MVQRGISCKYPPRRTSNVAFFSSVDMVKSECFAVGRLSGFQLKYPIPPSRINVSSITPSSSLSTAWIIAPRPPPPETVTIGYIVKGYSSGSVF